MSNYEAFKNLAAGIQSIGLCLAVIVGGVWSLYTFYALRLKKKAESDLFEQAVLDITIDAKQEHFTDKKEHFVAAVATVVNKGNRNTFLDFRGTPAFEVSKVAFDGAGIGIPERIMKMDSGHEYLTLRRGATWRFPILFRVLEPGFYLVTFKVRLSDKEMLIHDEVAQDSASQRGVKIVWAGANYVAVA